MQVTINRIIPTWAAGTVSLANPHYTLYQRLIGSGDCYLLDDGRVRLDDQIVAPGDVLYLGQDQRFHAHLPQADLDHTASQLQAYISTLVGVSAAINRTVARRPVLRPMPDGVGIMDTLLFDDGRNSWQVARYPAARPGWGSDLRQCAAVDAISETHDPLAIRDFAVRQHLDSHQKFVVGGYLHVAHDAQATDRFKCAILAYRSRGGSLGKTALDMLGEPSQR